jgi:hypothetical protein
MSSYLAIEAKLTTIAQQKDQASNQRKITELD